MLEGGAVWPQEQAHHFYHAGGGGGGGDPHTYKDRC